MYAGVEGSFRLHRDSSWQAKPPRGSACGGYRRTVSCGVKGCSSFTGGTEVGPALWAAELLAPGTAVYALPGEDPGSGSRGGSPGYCQHLDVTVPAAVPALQGPALCLFPRIHQPHQWCADRRAGWVPEGQRAGASGGGAPQPSEPPACFPTGTPHALIVRRYLSLLDAAVELELPGYRGPRLPRRQQVPIFPQPLITDRARCKYRWMGQPGGGEGTSPQAAQSRRARGTLNCRPKWSREGTEMGLGTRKAFAQGGEACRSD